MRKITGVVVKSALPHTPGNTILVGHRDTSFAFLQNLKTGDQIIMEDRNGERYRYTVSGSTVAQRDAIYLRSVDERWLTLSSRWLSGAKVTCQELSGQLHSQDHEQFPAPAPYR